jgi:hypothetical protein
MAIVRNFGAKFAKHLFLAKSLLRGDRVAADRVEADKAIYRAERSKAIHSAVETFKTRAQFVKTMSPLDDYKDDPTAWDFIQGVLTRFAEIEKEKNDGFDWVHRPIRAQA